MTERPVKVGAAGCVCGGAGGAVAPLPCNREANFKVVVLCIILTSVYHCQMNCDDVTINT